MASTDSTLGIGTLAKRATTTTSTLLAKNITCRDRRIITDTGSTNPTTRKKYSTPYCGSGQRTVGRPTSHERTPFEGLSSRFPEFGPPIRTDQHTPFIRAKTKPATRLDTLSKASEFSVMSE
eukprot:GHVN01061032.1.p1 GENE.GHVN01061032.1~~GHVN01061032.1.p1  ORF type:complete len:122 (-),score=7.00 GHVN01061032.1:198-563(-)